MTAYDAVGYVGAAIGAAIGVMVPLNYLRVLILALLDWNNGGLRKPMDPETADPFDDTSPTGWN